MSAFLQRLAARSLAALPVLEPRRAARFEPSEAPVADESPALAGPAADRSHPAQAGDSSQPAIRTALDDVTAPVAPPSRRDPDETNSTPPSAPRPERAEPPPAVVIHHHAAPLLVAEPLPARPVEAAVDSVPTAASQSSPPLLESRPAPQLLAQLPEVPMAMRQGGPRPAAGPLAAALPAAREEVHISIGRIEIKAQPAHGQPPKSRPGANGAPSTLDTYLQQRGRRTP